MTQIIITRLYKINLLELNKTLENKLLKFNKYKKKKQGNGRI